MCNAVSHVCVTYSKAALPPLVPVWNGATLDRTRVGAETPTG